MIPVITIDGPGGTGKGTVGQRLAEELAWHFLDSGSLYRVLAFAAQQQQIADNNEAALAALAGKLEIAFRAATPGGMTRVYLAGKDVTETVRSETCGNLASKISALPAVRQALLELQRSFRKPPGLVTDGRDMGTIIFPDAQLKVFLTATPEERAQRRYNQLKEKGIDVSLAQLCQELIERDQRDQQRAVAPLKPASDAVIIDTTHLTVDEVLQQMRLEVRSVFG